MRASIAVLCAAFEPPDPVPLCLGSARLRPGLSRASVRFAERMAARFLGSRAGHRSRRARCGIACPACGGSFGVSGNRRSVWISCSCAAFSRLRRTEHITESARRLGTTQPALSRSIRALEQELGVSLFERSGRNVRLTPCGELLRRRGVSACGGDRRLGRELAAFCEGGRHVVRIDVRAASEAVTEAMEAYKRKRPDTRFELGRGADRAGCDVLVDALGADKELAGVVRVGRLRGDRLFRRAHRRARFRSNPACPNRRRCVS